MRDILFRGIREDNGEWLISDSILHIDNSRVALWAKQGGWREVLPDTVGRCIGLPDKNGREIFEHDFLKDENGFIHEVYFDGGCFMRRCGLRSSTLATTHQVLEVVGNSHDNPNLLEAKHNGD